MHTFRQPPVVLIIAGNDPSGGAGLAADTQAVTALGAHPAPVIAALTVQDTLNAYHVVATSAKLVVAQAQAVLKDMPVAAIKLGLLASADSGQAVAEMLALAPRNSRGAGSGADGRRWGGARGRGTHGRIS